MRWIAFKTLVRREFGVIARYWLVTLAPPAISTTLYFTIFGGVLGPRVGLIGGVHYMDYMVPGLIVLTTIPSAYMHSAAGLLGARNYGFIEELLVAPQPRWIILLGYVAGGVMRGVCVALVTMIIAMIFTGFGFASLGMSLATACLIALVAATAGCIVGLIANSFERVSMVQGLILVPLAFVGGVFIPVANLPEWAQHFSLANPVFYMVSAVRCGLGGACEVAAGLSRAVVVSVATILLLVAARVADRRLRDRSE